MGRINKFQVYGFVVILLIATIVSYISFRTLQNAREAAGWVQHTREVLDILEHTRTGIAAVEELNKQYFEKSAPELYTTILSEYKRVETNCDSLIHLVSDNKEQYYLADSLHQAFPNILLAGFPGSSAIATEKGLDRQERFITDSYRGLYTLISTIRRNELLLLSVRESNNTAYINQAYLVLVLVTVVFFASIIGMSALLLRSEKKRDSVENELLDSKNYYSGVFASLNEPIVILDQGLRVNNVNKAYQEYFQCTEAGVLGRNLSEIHNNAWNNPEFLQKLHETSLGKTLISDFRMDFSLNKKNDLTFLVNARNITSSGSGKGLLLISMFDISGKVKAENERDRFFTLSPEVLMVLQPGGIVQSVNPAWERILGHAPERILRKNLFDFCHPEDLQFFQHTLFSLAGNVYGQHAECRMLCADNSFRWFLWNFYLIQSEELVFASAYDITNEKALTAKFSEYAEAIYDLYENAPCGYHELDSSGRIVRINKTEARLLGYDKEEMLGKHIFDFVTEKDAARKFLNEIKAQTDREHQGEFHFIHKNGSLLYMHSVDKTISVSGRSETVIRATTQNISALKDAQDAMGRYADELEDLYNNAPCGYHSLDSNGYFSLINNTELNWLQYSREELVGKKKFTELITPESRAVFLNNFPQFKQQGWIKDLSFELIRKDGTHFITILSATAVYDSNGNYQHSRSTLFDITDLSLLRTEQRRLAAIVNSSVDVIYSVDFSGKIVSWNKAAAELYEYQPEEVLGQSMELLMTDLEKEEVSSVFSQLLTGQEVKPNEVKRITKTGKEILVSMTLSPIIDTWGKIIGASAIERDITEKKLAEENIKKLNKSLLQREAALIETNKELEAFSYSVSHDLRAPLRHIDGFVDLLRKRSEDKLDAASVRYLGIISGSAKQMGMLIDDLLAFSKIGRAELRRHAVDLDELLKEVLHDFQQEISSRNIELQIEPLPGVVADRALLRLVFVNLISNAIKYTGKTSVPRIVIKSIRSESEVAVLVKDNGAGFDMKYADKLFGVFQRLHRSEEFEGTGIGLANVRRIITRHGGRVWAEGVVDQGAEFGFALPVESEK